MVQTVPFTNNTMNKAIGSGTRFNYHHHVRFGRLRGDVMAAPAGSKRSGIRCSISLYSYLAKVIIVVLLLVVCIINMKIAFEQHNHYEKRAFVYYQSLERDIDDNELTTVVTTTNDEKNNFFLQVMSSGELAKITVNDKTVYQDKRRGIHVLMLNQQTGLPMGARCFDTHLPHFDDLLLSFVDAIADRDRILVFTVVDDASLAFVHYKRIELGRRFGSKLIVGLGWRDAWALVSTRRGIPLAEKLVRHLNTTQESRTELVIDVVVNPRVLRNYNSCRWPTTDANRRRVQFCSRYDGYGQLCRCEFTSPYNMTRDAVKDNVLNEVPVLIIASNRPHYLHRCLSSLHLAAGVNPRSITVFIDGRFIETMEVARLFNVTAFYHTPTGTGSARISHNYKSSLKATFKLFPHSRYAIIVEDDLEVSPDFFRYFNHLLPVLEKDPTVYCISAWNDHGYEHSAHDPGLFYRVETMPGLGWLLKRSLFEDELLPGWPGPDVQWDWDMWMRRSEVRRGRECVIPDVSRTYHFGMSGVNTNTHFFRLYFSNHKLNRNSSAVYRPASSLLETNYERTMHELVRDGTLLDHSKSPCDRDFIPATSPPTNFVAFFKHNPLHENGGTFRKILKCLKVWDLDNRGLHKGAFRTFISGQHVLLVGCPLSPYSIYKPVHVKPIEL